MKGGNKGRVGNWEFFFIFHFSFFIFTLFFFNTWGALVMDLYLFYVFFFELLLCRILYLFFPYIFILGLDCGPGFRYTCFSFRYECIKLEVFDSFFESTGSNVWGWNEVMMID